MSRNRDLIILLTSNWIHLCIKNSSLYFVLSFFPYESSYKLWVRLWLLFNFSLQCCSVHLLQRWYSSLQALLPCPLSVVYAPAIEQLQASSQVQFILKTGQRSLKVFSTMFTLVDSWLVILFITYKDIRLKNNRDTTLIFR